MGTSASISIDARKGREKLLLFISSCLTAVLSLHILDLGLDNLSFKLTLIPILVAGFIFSYFLDEKYQGLARWSVNVLAVFFAVHYFRLIQADPYSLGNSLGMLLGVLMVLLAYAAFRPGSHSLFPCIGVVFTLFSAATSYELKIVIFFPILMVFSAILLYFSNSIELMARHERFGLEEVGEKAVGPGGFSIFWVLFRVVAVVFLMSVLVYIVVPHYTDVNRPAFLLPRSGSLPSPVEELTLPNPEESEKLAEGELNITGFSEEFDLSGSTSVLGSRSLFESDKPAIAMRSSQNAYLRGIVFDVYLGGRWVRSKAAEENRIVPIGGRTSYILSSIFEFPLIDFPSRKLARSYLREKGLKLVAGNIFSTSEAERLRYEFHTQEIEFLKDHPPVLFSSYQPVRLDNLSAVRGAEGRRRFADPTLDIFSVVSTRLPRHPAGYEYTVTVLAPKVQRRDLALLDSPPPQAITSHYTQLPTEENKVLLEREYQKDVIPVGSKVRHLAQTIVSGATTRYEKVQKIYEYLQDEFTYSLEFMPLPKGVEATEFFLFNSRSGYCMQFASAMVVLLRLNGIPSRVVAGYAPGSYSVIQNKYIYRDKNAHAWVEVYFDGYGWIAFDPSPTGSDLFRISGLKGALTATLDFFENLFVIDPTGAQQTLLRLIAGLFSYLALRAYRIWPIVLIGALLILSFILLIFLALKRRKRSTLVPQNSVVAQYILLQNILERYAFPRDAGETISEYFQRIGQLLSPLEEDIKTFINIYDTAAFSPRPPSAKEANSCAEFVRRVRIFLREGSWRKSGYEGGV